MTDREWDKDASGNYLNILKDFNDNDINYFEKLFFKKGSKYYQITGVEYEGNGMYRRTIVEVDSEGAWLSDPEPEEQPVFVNSNFKLWELFGGYRSCDLVNGKLTIVFGEHYKNIDIYIKLALKSTYEVLFHRNTIDDTLYNAKCKLSIIKFTNSKITLRF